VSMLTCQEAKIADAIKVTWQPLGQDWVPSSHNNKTYLTASRSVAHDIKQYLRVGCWWAHNMKILNIHATHIKKQYS
jgi:hypothetical protein